MIMLRNRDLLARLASNPNVVEFMMKLKPDELVALREFTAWPPAVMAKLQDEPAHLSVLHRMWDKVVDHDGFIKTYFTLYEHPTVNKNSLIDAFSQGQLDSKGWLIDTVADLNLDLGRTWTLCGWYGTLAYLMFLKKSVLKFSSVRSFDINPTCALLADTLNRPAVIDGWKFKATTIDVNRLHYDSFRFNTVKYDGTVQEVMESADTVINTSCDHMDSQKWFDRIPDGKLVILQNNDFAGHDDHVNTVQNLEQFRSRYPMTEYLYQGELDCKVYKRFMLIGRI